jgi:Cu(I)/Ag(I) efflux system membrane fusion protein
MPARIRILVFSLCLGTFFGSCHKAPEAKSHVQGRRILYYQDPMHPSYRSDRPGLAPDCQMELVPVYADADESVVRPGLVRVNNAQAAAMGLRTEAARDETSGGEVRTVGRVQTSESQTYQVTAGDDGWIRKVHGGETGTFVVKGQPLASYYSRDIASPQQAFLYALDSHERVRILAGASPEQKELAAKQLKQTHDYLEFLGMTDRQIAELEDTRQESRELTLAAPASGVVLERKVSEGTRFAKGDVLWKIGNIDSVWVIADLFAEDLSAISGIRKATVLLADGSQNEATVDSSLPQFDTDNRVAKLRLIVKNTGHRLLPGMSVTVRLQKAALRGLTVPAESVIESGILPRVFVRRDDGIFEARVVTTGWRNAGRLQILSGLEPGEQVVVAGAFLIDSESRINEYSR